MTDPAFPSSAGAAPEPSAIRGGSRDGSGVALLPLYAGPCRDGGTGHHGGFCKPYSWDRPKPRTLPEFPCESCGGEGVVTWDDWSRNTSGEGGPDEGSSECDECGGDGMARCCYCVEAVEDDGVETGDGSACAACAAESAP